MQCIFEYKPRRRPTWVWAHLYFTPKRDHFVTMFFMNWCYKKLWLYEILSKSNELTKYIISSHATLKETFTAKIIMMFSPEHPKCSLRADEIKPWLTPSAKQCRNPCSRLPAVYPDLSTRHDWPVKKGLCFVCRDRQSGWREIRNALPVIRWVRWWSRTRISALLRRRY